MAIREIGRVARALCALAVCVVAAGAQGEPAPVRATGAWTLIPVMPGEQIVQEKWIRAERYQSLVLDEAALRNELAKLPTEEDAANAGGEAKWVEMWLPAPDGVLMKFRVCESSVMEKPLQEKYPEIRTYLGQGVDDPWATVRMSLTPQGFAAQVLSPTTGAWYIDRFTRFDKVYYTSYWKHDLMGPAEPFQCLTPGADPDVGVRRMQLRGGNVDPQASGQSRRQYRIAVATAGEYTAFHGGTVALGLAAVTAVINRVTQVYENEFAIRLVLVANEDQVIFTNSSTDPFTSPGANNSTLNAGQSAIRNAAGIGTSGFDVGHTFIRASNAGVAGAIGNVCVTPPTSLTSNGSGKGRGVTGLTSPVGDAFAIDYVAHELGHQFGGRHNFNSCSGSQGDSGSLAVEPGSGSTIMGYAGICGSDNLQPNSDPYFNSLNIDQVITYVSTGSGSSCAAVTATGNTPPTVDAGASYTIPVSTPFTLTALGGADVNGDAITYCWEQQNGTSTVDTLPVTDLGTNPIARSWSPTVDPTRTFPRLQDLLNNNNVPIGEAFPTTSRAMTWRCTVRDNRAGGGGVNYDTTTITSTTTAGPFRVTSPNGGEAINGTVNVTWNVANTNTGSVNTANVRILLSIDGGQTFPTVLASSVPNTGSASVTLPSVQTATARVKIEAIGNIYFDISNLNFTINTPAGTPNLVSGGATMVSDPIGVGNGNGNGAVDPGENSVRLTIPVKNTGANPATAVSGTLVSLSPTVTVGTSISSYANVAFNSVVSNSTAYTITVSPAHTCGAPISLRLDLTYSSGLTSSISLSVPTGTGTAPNVTCAAPAAATGACCSSVSAGSCSVLAFTPCIQGGGSYKGDATVCTPNPCVVINGACCFGAACVLATSNECALDEGTYFGDGTTCSPSPCVPPMGSCCVPDGSCAVTAQASCAGVWSVGGVCEPNACPQPSGACCAADGSCSLTLQASCAGTWSINGACVPNDCPQPMGSCCAPDGSCSVVAQAACDSVWTVAGSCTPNVCPQPTGACCATDGSCSIVTEVNCAGSWTVSGSCTPNACPQPTGVCCSGTTCSITTQAVCVGTNRHWVGAASECNASGDNHTPCCKADFDQSGALTIDDLFVFLAAWFNNNPQAAITSNGGAVAIDDIFVYINTFFGGCP
jgi:hypothetical protein